MAAADTERHDVPGVIPIIIIINIIIAAANNILSSLVRSYGVCGLTKIGTMLR